MMYPFIGDPLVAGAVQLRITFDSTTRVDGISGVSGTCAAKILSVIEYALYPSELRASILKLYVTPVITPDKI